jgi:hypothetical protein
MDTLYLTDDWDLTVDSFGNIAVANAPYAIAQDVASECKLWKGEARYDTTKGIPYETSILGRLPPPAKLMAWYKEAAEGVPGVAESKVILQYGNRTLSGQIQCTLEDGEKFSLNF